MTDTTPTLDDSENVLAAEYVLGVLGRTERGEVAERLKTDVPFQRRVAEWEERLAAMNDGFASVEPPKTIKADLTHRLFESDRRNDRFFGRLWVWKALSTAAIALLMLSIFYPKLPETQTFVASLSQEDDSRQFIAMLESDGSVRIVQVAGDAEAEKSYELWLIEGDTPPVSLGILGETGLPEDWARPIPVGATLAVSVEQLGGSPSGVPEGPVVATGTLSGI